MPLETRTDHLASWTHMRKDSKAAALQRHHWKSIFLLEEGLQGTLLSTDGSGFARVVTKLYYDRPEPAPPTHP